MTETEVQKAHKKYYSDEIKLNETFQRFASNVYLAYQGPNTARAQIGSRFDTSESIPIGEVSAAVIHIISVVSYI